MTKQSQNYRAVLLALGLCLLAAMPVSGPASAQSPEGTEAQPNPSAAEEEVPKLDLKADWPCVQGKVEDLSVSSMWDGPPVDGKKVARDDKQTYDLIELLAARRTPVEAAEAALKTYAESIPAAERDEKLTVLFAGLFDKVNTQRRSVVHGIEKYQRAQKERSAELENQSTAIAKLESAASTNQDSAKQLDDANEKFAWAQRIFQERQQSLPLACELPTVIEQRLYTVAQAIRALMKS